MSRISRLLRHAWHTAAMLLTLVLDTTRFLRLCLHTPVELAAENLFLRKQLALYQEQDVKPKRATNTTRFALVWLSRWFDWRQALRVVQPETFLRWHRQGFRLFWRWKSQPGRPQIPAELQALIPFGQIIQTHLFVSSYTPFHAHSSSCILLCHASYSPSVGEEPGEGEQPHGLEDVTGVHHGISRPSTPPA